jgi:hypothetical protein
MNYYERIDILFDLIKACHINEILVFQTIKPLLAKFWVNANYSYCIVKSHKYTIKPNEVGINIRYKNGACNYRKLVFFNLYE